MAISRLLFFIRLSPRSNLWFHPPHSHVGRLLLQSLLLQIIPDVPRDLGSDLPSNDLCYLWVLTLHCREMEWVVYKLMILRARIPFVRCIKCVVSWASFACVLFCNQLILSVFRLMSHVLIYVEAPETARLVTEVSSVGLLGSCECQRAKYYNTASFSGTNLSNPQHRRTMTDNILSATSLEDSSYAAVPNTILSVARTIRTMNQRLSNNLLPSPLLLLW